MSISTNLFLINYLIIYLFTYLFIKYKFFSLKNII